jgi:dipeptidyl aminopeptidase/acylaminoacyl peptidase
MITDDRVATLLAAWFNETAPSAPPVDLLDDVNRLVAATANRRTWAAPASPRRTLGILVLLAALLTVAVVTAALVAGDHPAPRSSTFLVYSGYVDSADSQVVVANPDGTDVRRLTTTPGSKRNPTASPDGRLVAFLSPRPGPFPGKPFAGPYVGVVDVATATERPLTGYSTIKDGDFVRLTWSPSSAYLAVEDLGGIRIIDVRSGEKVAAVDSAWGVAWMPDGRSFLYARGGSLWRRPVAGQPTGVVEQLANEPAYGVTVTADGTVWFGGAAGLMTVRPDGSHLSLVVPGGAWPQASPDGRRVAFHLAAVTGSGLQSGIWVVDADGGNLRRLAALPASPSLLAWDPAGERLSYPVDGGFATVRLDGAPGQPISLPGADTSWPWLSWAQHGGS